MIPEWPGEADTARLILAIEAHEPQGWWQRVAGWWWTAWDATWGRARRTATLLRGLRQEARPDDFYVRLFDAYAAGLDKTLDRLRERERLLTGALGDATHPYGDPGGGDSGCEWEVPPGERMVPGQVCGQSAWHPVHRTPDVVLDNS